MAIRLDIHPKNPQPRAIAQAVAVLKEGGVIVYPTDTIYGLGCAASMKRGVERIVSIKGRDPKKPFSIVCSDLSHLSEYAQVSNFAFRILRRFLPGAYTFVLPAHAKVPKLLLTRQKTIGIRIPAHPVPIALVEALGEPIISTSANRSSKDVLTDPDEVEERLGNPVDLILSAGVLPVEPSTVVSLVDDRVEILRRGAGDVRFFEEMEKR